jgi:hypothetical protein
MDKWIRSLVLLNTGDHRAVAQASFTEQRRKVFMQAKACASAATPTIKMREPSLTGRLFTATMFNLTEHIDQGLAQTELSCRLSRLVGSN